LVFWAVKNFDRFHRHKFISVSHPDLLYNHGSNFRFKRKKKHPAAEEVKRFGDCL
jgi:hypothetical protein